MVPGGTLGLPGNRAVGIVRYSCYYGGSVVSRIVAQFVRELIWRGGLVVYRRWFRLQTFGYEHLPSKGPYLLVANHASHLDGPAVMAAQRVHFRNVYSLGATDYFFSTTTRRWISTHLLNMIAFDRYRVDLHAVEECRQITANGDRILVFPEGTRSVDGSINRFKPVFGLIARRLGIPIVPVYIHGAFESLPKGRRWPRRRRLYVCFGSTIDPKAYDSKVEDRRSLYPRIADEIYLAIVTLREQLLGTAVLSDYSNVSAESRYAAVRQKA